jgi:hypothetical protein
MWSDEFDKKIQAAADNHLPPFQEEDWNRMNALLNKHLPQEKKQRRFIPLLFLLLGGFPMLVILTTYKQAPVESIKPGKNDQASVYSEKKPGTQHEVTVNTTTIAGSENSYPDLQLPGNKPIKESAFINNQKQERPRKTTGLLTEKTNKEKRPANVGEDVVKTRNETSIQEKGETSADLPDSNPVNNNQQLTEDTATIITTVKEAEDTTVTEINKGNKKTGKGGKWQISFSAGPDLSIVGVSKSGNWKMQYGVGIGYSISERIQLRTGFMVSRKLYYADSSDYNPPKGFWAYYPNLQKIDANCLVYEIPLNVVYTFPSSKKHQWFVSGGLSSYLMKQETYEYYYKDPSGQTRYRERTINNENNHFLSILHISGGYLYKFNDKLSLMAEPYSKLPLAGIGFGKVKLNNTGVLFTVGYKPFGKRSK